MRVLLVTHYFPPEIGAPQVRLADLVGRWAASGDDVTVLTGMPNHPTGVVPPEYRRRVRVEEQVGGYRIVRTWLYATPNEGVFKKTLGHLSFMITSVLLGSRRAGPADVVVVSSPTFLSILSAWFLARIKRAKLVVEVRDLWPAIFVELGILRNRTIIRALERVELAAYGAADVVVTVTDGFRDDVIARGVPAQKVHTIFNGADVGRFHVSPEAAAAQRARLAADAGELVVLYAGAHGISHGLVSVADAAAKLRDEAVRFVFVGEGAAKRDLANRVAELGLSNVTMLPGVPHEDVPALLAAADVCLAPLRDVPLFATFVPSKIFEYLAAGRPVIGAVTGEPAAILRRAGAVVVPPEDPGALADAIRELRADPARREEIGEQGKRYVAEHFDRGLLAARYHQLLADIVG